MSKDPENDDLLPEYDFSGGVRGKYAARMAGGANVVVIAPDSAKHSPTLEAVDQALCSSDWRACPGTARVFVSHSSSDSQFTRRLARDLQARGHDIWLDEWQIRVGECIPTRIEQGLRESQFVVVVMSARACASHWVDREWKTRYWDEVNSNQLIILPALIENCEIPQLLKTKRYADFRADYETGLLQLLASIEPSQLVLADASSSRRSSAALDLLRATQARQLPLSNILVDILSQARELGSSELLNFARSEISGYETRSGPLKKGESPMTELEHRQISGYLSTHEVNTQFFGWSGDLGAALTHMRQEPKTFRPFTIIFSDPIVRVESQLLGSSSQKLLALKLPTTLFTGKPSSSELNFYAAGDTFSNMYERIRVQLVKQLSALA
jgi:hypothetical protein